MACWSGGTFAFVGAPFLFSVASADPACWDSIARAHRSKPAQPSPNDMNARAAQYDAVWYRTVQYSRDTHDEALSAPPTDPQDQHQPAAPSFQNQASMVDKAAGGRRRQAAGGRRGCPTSCHPQPARAAAHRCEALLCTAQCIRNGSKSSWCVLVTPLSADDRVPGRGDLERHRDLQRASQQMGGRGQRPTPILRRGLQGPIRPDLAEKFGRMQPMHDSAHGRWWSPELFLMVCLCRHPAGFILDRMPYWLFYQGDLTRRDNKRCCQVVNQNVADEGGRSVGAWVRGCVGA